MNYEKQFIAAISTSERENVSIAKLISGFENAELVNFNMTAIESSK